MHCTNITIHSFYLIIGLGDPLFRMQKVFEQIIIDKLILTVQGKVSDPEPDMDHSIFVGSGFDLCRLLILVFRSNPNIYKF